MALAIGLHFLYYSEMKKSSTVIRKKKGRPPTGETPVMTIRLTHQERAAIDAWAADQEDKLDRSKAIRRLIPLALEAEAKKKGGKK